jgi:hypothetical protein
MPDRTKTHGEYLDQADMAERIRNVMFCRCPMLPNYQKAALTLIAEKLSRIITGDSNFEDHWLDIAGYCERVLEILRKEAHGKE